MPNSHVYHYAPGAYLPKILDSGYLRPSNAGAHKTDPLLWFSSADIWEPTATKLFVDAQGNIRQMTFKEQLKSLGCIRFRLSAADLRLMPWRQAVQSAGFERQDVRSLEIVGRRRGASPANWFGSLASIALQELTAEVFSADQGWQPLAIEEGAAA